MTRDIQYPEPGFRFLLLTLEIPSILYGSQIFGAVVFVTMIKYSIHAIVR